MAKKTNKLSSMVSNTPVPVKIVSDAPAGKTDGDWKKRERRYQAEDDIRTMQRAAEIQKDKDRTKAMKEVAKEQVNALKKIC